MDITSFVSSWSIDPDSADAFQMFETTINPMNADLFPAYIQNLASSYSYWKLLRSEFLVNPVLAPADRGQLMYAYLPDPTTAAPQNIRDLLNIQGSNSVTAWTSLQSFMPEGVDQIDWRSIGQGFPMALNDQAKLGTDVNVMAPLDPRFSDKGRVFFASTGLSSGVPGTIATVRYRYHLVLAGLRMTDIQPCAAITVQSPYGVDNNLAVPSAVEPNAFWATQPGNLGIRLVNSLDYPAAPGSVLTGTPFSCLSFSRVGTYVVNFDVEANPHFNPSSPNVIAIHGTPPSDPAQQTVFIAHAEDPWLTGVVSNDRMRCTLYVKVTNSDHAFVFGLYSSLSGYPQRLTIEAVATSSPFQTTVASVKEITWSPAPCVFTGLGS